MDRVAYLLTIMLLACPMGDSEAPRAYILHGTCDSGCHAGLWFVSCRTKNRLLWVFNGRWPTLREFASASNAASELWILAWRQWKRT